MEPILRDIAAALGERLRGLGVTAEFVRRCTEPDPGLQLALTCRREARFLDDPAVLAVRLLFCGEALTLEETVAAFGELRPPALHTRIVAGLYIMSDYLGAGAAAEAVMGAGETTAVLWQAARPSRRIGATLDLGCGAGTLALLLAGHAERVVGADINARAVEMSRFNAALNGIGNVEFRCGDLYQPVEGERFDLIVSQPPYYPGGELTFLHGGRRGDEIARRVVDGVAGRLCVGGRALVLSSWPEDWWPLRVDGHNVIALTADRCEVPGAEPGIVAIEPGSAGVSLRYRLSPECWGDAASGDIDGLFAGRLPAVTRRFEEDGVRWEVRRLFGLATRVGGIVEAENCHGHDRDQ